MHGVLSTAYSNDHIYADPCTWYALLIESGAERKATIWLKRRQYKPYWPRYMGHVKLNRHRRGMRWRSVIPGYLFLPIPTEREAGWQLIEQTPGVRGVMRHADYNFVEFKEQDIADVSRIEKALNESPVAATEGIPFRVGQMVRIVRGIFEGHQTAILSIERGRKIGLEVPWMNSTTKIILPVSEIEAA